MITQEQLKNALHYDPETGSFKRLNSKISKLNGKVINRKPTAHGYINICAIDREYPAHRLAWLYVNGEMPDGMIDHINHIKTDNRISNLREVSSKENQKNQAKKHDSHSGVIGVQWHKHKEKWIASVRVDGENIHIGQYDLFRDAVRAREESNIKYGFHCNHGK